MFPACPGDSLNELRANVSDTANKEVLVSYPQDGVAVVLLNRPEATNALSLPLQDLLSEAFTMLGADDSVRCIVLTGGDKVFAAGGDILGLLEADPIEIMQRHTELVWAPLE